MDKSGVDIKSHPQFLALLVIEQAVRDLKDPKFCDGIGESELVREDAELFLKGRHGRGDLLEAWCNIGGINVNDLQRRVFK